jgi:proteic killer suppression protein
MIKTFKDRDTAGVYFGYFARHLPHQLQKIALRKLLVIDEARTINDLRMPPGNRLEELSGEMQGYHSIRINNQWRIRFRWLNNAAYEVEITDYH